MLLSLIHPSEGHIEIFDQSLTSNRSAILEQVGAVIERPDLYPYLTAQEHLTLFAKLRKQKITAAKIEATLAQVGLLSRANDKVQTYSLGMKQRLGIAAALLPDPKLLMLDEPTNHLDLESITAFNNSLSNFKGSVLFTTHDHEFAQTVGNRILELTPNGAIDRYMTFDEYLEDEKIKELRLKMYS